MKLEKLQKLRMARQQKNQPSQTIIINNPNININYLAGVPKNNFPQNGPYSSRGLDNWNLNQNLKQFSETRQLGFFKNKKQRNKSNSPYIIHKVRTQDIKSLNKILPFHNNQSNLNQTLSKFNKNQTINHTIPIDATVEIQHLDKNKAQLESILVRHERTMTDKLYNPYKKTKADFYKQYQTIPTKLNVEKTNNTQNMSKAIRKGRFQPIGDIMTIPFQNNKDNEQNYKQQFQADTPLFQNQEQQKIKAPRMISYEMRRRLLNKTIANIDKTFLSQTENYFQKVHGEKLLQTNIQLFVNSLNNPQQLISTERNMSYKDNQLCQYDFNFDGQKKKRPKTPKKKKQISIFQ